MKQKSFLVLSLFFSLVTKTDPLPLYFCTAAETSYYQNLLNLIGSIHETNFDNLGEIAIFDLGLKQNEIEHLRRIKKVNIYPVELTHPDLLKIFTTSPWGKTVPGWYAWKPVVIKQALDILPYVLYIDAGTTILKPLDDLLEYIEDKGYFIGTIGNEFENGQFRHPIKWGTTQRVRKLFNLDSPENKEILDKEFIMGNIVGLSRKSKDLFLSEWYGLSKDLDNFKDDGTTPNGFGTGRHDQTILSILGYLNKLTIHQQDYTQAKPINLVFKNKQSNLYITWHPESVCSKTHIYSSRYHLENIQHYLQQIRYKE